MKDIKQWGLNSWVYYQIYLQNLFSKSLIAHGNQSAKSLFCADERGKSQKLHKKTNRVGHFLCG